MMIQTLQQKGKVVMIIKLIIKYKMKIKKNNDTNKLNIKSNKKIEIIWIISDLISLTCQSLRSTSYFLSRSNLITSAWPPIAAEWMTFMWS